MALAQSVGFGSEAADALTKQVLSLRNLANKRRDSVGSVLDALEVSLKKSELTKSDLANDFAKVRNAFEYVTASEAVGLLLKSIEVYSDQAAAIFESRVFTEVRPIFSGDRQAVVGAAVFNRLRLEYGGAEGVKSIELTLDASTLDELAEQLSVAKDKTRVLKDLLKDRVGVQRIYSDESDFSS